jgi:His/Glu/Gln/Arg/opine family amino acid ABC transporter permease subunit
LSLSPRRAAGRAAALVALALLGGCAQSYSWGWYTVLPTTPQGATNLRFLASGFAWTIALTVCAYTASLLLGLLVALPLTFAGRFGAALARAYVEIFRAVPTLVMLLWVYYGLPVVIGISLDAFSAAVIALALCESAFQAEIFRGGIQSIERGQREAADALGLSWADKMRFVILPQAIRRMLPPLGNQLVYTLKMSALASVIGVTELVRRANELVVNIYRPLEIYTVLFLEYLLLVLIVSWAVRRLERRLGADAGADRAA